MTHKGVEDIVVTTTYGIHLLQLNYGLIRDKISSTLQLLNEIHELKAKIEFEKKMKIEITKVLK